MYPKGAVQLSAQLATISPVTPAGLCRR